LDRESVIGITFAVILFSPFLCYDVRMDFNFLNQKNLKEKGKKDYLYIVMPIRQ